MSGERFVPGLVRLRGNRRGDNRRVRGRRGAARGDFLHDLRGEFFAHWAGSVVNAALRERKPASAVAGLGIHALQRRLFLLGVRPVKSTLGSSVASSGILQKDLAGILESFDGGIYRQTQQQPNFGFIKTRSNKALHASAPHCRLDSPQRAWATPALRHIPQRSRGRPSQRDN